MAVRVKPGASLQIGIVAGESSGDQLGAALIHALRARAPQIEVSGIAGPRMIAAGCRELAHIDELSVMGLVEVVRHYPRLRALRERLFRHFSRVRTDVFIGIDVPDFVLNLEMRLHRLAVPTVHYGCPQLWAWREKRVDKIKQAVDVLLALFPFEETFFCERGINTRFVGHPLAEQIPQRPDRCAARRRLGLDLDDTVVALLPGSRRQELQRHWPLFVDAAEVLRKRSPAVRLVSNLVATADEAWLDGLASRADTVSVAIFRDAIDDVLASADVALAVSGSVTLQAMCWSTPLVVAYRLAPVSYHIMKRVVRTPFIAMPNLLADGALVPEFIQHQATAESLANAVQNWLEHPSRVAEYRRTCARIHAQLSRDSAAHAADAVLDLIAARGRGCAEAVAGA